MNTQPKPVTKEELREELKGFATKADLSTLEQNVDIKLISLKHDLEEKIENIDEKNRGYRDQILTSLDKVAKELETWREDKILADHQLENHEERITQLESPTH